MGTYLNHKLTFIFSEDESYWASKLPEGSPGWYSDENYLDTWGNEEVRIQHTDAHPGYFADYGPKLSKCGRILQINTGCYGSYNLSSWKIPNTLIAIVSQWDNTQCSDCFLLKTILAKNVCDFNWFPGAYKNEYLGDHINKLAPKNQYIDSAGFDSWGVWATMNEAAVMQQTPIDIELPVNLIELSTAKIGPPKELIPLYEPKNLGEN